MSPQAKKTIIPLSLIVSSIIALSAWALRSGAQIVDARYVHTDSFAIKSLRDSLNYRSDLRDIKAALVHLDSDFHNPRGKP